MIEYAEVCVKSFDQVNRVIESLLLAIVLQTLEAVEMKDVFMCFLLTLSKDFDDDLLQDAMELLVDL
jgi:hypothetical protein